MEALQLAGFTNPVTAAQAFIQASGVDVDARSFKIVGNIVGDMTVSPGFMLSGFQDLMKLCEIGKFEIIMTADGYCTAVYRGESIW